MSAVATLTEQQIRAWVGSSSFDRGRSYAANRRIFNQRQVGPTLKAQCHGSETYDLYITLNHQGIVSGLCSCPIGDGGTCKHVAALLLTWLANPESFIDQPEPIALLQNLSKEELIKLILKMLERAPNLDQLLALSTVTGPLDRETLRKQIQQALGRSSWGNNQDTVSDIEEILELGETYFDQDDFSNAALLYHEVAHTILEEYDNEYNQYDDESDLINQVGFCVNKLGKCLTEITNPEQRLSLILALWEIYCCDIEELGLGFGDQVPEILAGDMTEEETEIFLSHLQALFDETEPGYNRQALGEFLLELQSETLDDEGYLALCRSAQLDKQLVERLLTLNRLEEALAIFRQATPNQVMRLIPIFEAANHLPEVEAIVRERNQQEGEHVFRTWLKQLAEKRGDFSEALSIAQAEYQKSLNLNRYLEVQRFAQKCQQWEALEANLLGDLEQQKNYDLLTQIHLQAKRIPAALQSLDKLMTSNRNSSHLILEVAVACMEDLPHDAIRLYLVNVHRLIGLQGRSNYAAATQHLQKIQQCYQKLGQPKEWERLITEIRTEFRVRPALQDELTKGKL